MSRSIEVGEENHLPIMEKLEEQEIKEIVKKIEKIECRNILWIDYPFLEQPNLETHADEKWRLKALDDFLADDKPYFIWDLKILQMFYVQMYADAIAEMKRKSKMFYVQMYDDAIAEMKRKSKMFYVQMYDDAIAEMKRKSKMKKGSHSSFKGINIEGEKEAIDRDTEIRIHKKHPIQDNTKKGSHSSFKVINIEGEKEAIDGDPDIRIHKKHLKQDHTIWATFFSSEIAIACCLGNPLDKLYKVESTGKVKEQSLINFGKAVPIYAPCITLTAIFFMNFIYTVILTRPWTFRMHANSMLLLVLMYYILALAEALSGCGVAWGSTEVPALMFVCGGAIGPMLLMGSIIMGLKSVFKPDSL